MVRLANINDKEDIGIIFGDAKVKFALDKTYQWKGDYPSIVDFCDDLNNNLVIVEERNNLVVGCATIVFTPDPNYKVIDGKWLNDEKYVSIHRIATRNNYYHQGVAYTLFKECERIALENNIRNIKIDTHELNKSMRNLIEKLGYLECGVIELLHRSDLVDKYRVAYQKIL